MESFRFLEPLIYSRAESKIHNLGSDRMIKAEMDSIIFDLDGTLWDSIDTVLLAWNKSIQNFPELNKVLTRTDLEGTMGLQMHDISKKLFPSLDEDLSKKLIEDWGVKEQYYLKQQGGQLYSNLEHVLKELSKKYKLFIVSNCQEGYIEAFFSYHQLDKYFMDFENPGRTGLSKGENINLVIKRNSLKQPVYVGDTEGDMKAARYAGVPFVYARYGFGKVQEHDFVIDELMDLLKLF